MWRRRWVDRSLGIGMSCKEENPYVGEIGVFLLFGHVSILFFYLSSLSLSLQISREKEKRFFYFFFIFLDFQFDKNYLY